MVCKTCREGSSLTSNALETSWECSSEATVNVWQYDTPNVVDTDPTEAFTTALSVFIHSSLFSIADRVPIQRHFGKSEVVCLAPGIGDRFIGSLHSAMRWSSRQQEWLKCSYITKVRHTMIRPQDHPDLLWTVSHQLSDNFIVENYLVEDIWRMWSISARHLDLHVHNMNKEQLKTDKRVLRSKGFTLTPDIEMVIRIPSSAQHSKYEVISALRQAVLVSFIPQRVCDNALQTARVVKLADRTLGSMLISARRWIIQMYSGSLPCTMSCGQYPGLASHTRHGHIFIPSWQYYTGFGYKTVQAHMQSVLASTLRPGTIATAIRHSWTKSLPDFFIPTIRDPETDRQRATMTDGHFNIDFVTRIVYYRSMLVVMGIAKCDSRCLIIIIMS